MFRAFLKLGLTSFGGPVAHLGYFRDELVTRRRWVGDKEYADLVALSQFLPGPASSQVGFALGLLRAGPLGALAAWLAFTAPSAVLMVAFAYGAPLFDNVVGSGILTGLKIVAVAIVAQAVWGMARALTPDARRASIAVGAALIVLFFAGSAGQVAAIVLGALAGLALCRTGTGEISGALPFSVSRRAGAVSLALFAVLLVGLPIAAALLPGTTIDIADGFYRAGALVFGGGHVVLPLLQAEVVAGGWVTPEEFLAGYGAAQAVPGPLVHVRRLPRRARRARRRGAVDGGGRARRGVPPRIPPPRRRPALLERLPHRPSAQSLMRGANAAVVGILAAALYDPVFVTAIVDPATFGLALVCFVLLIAWRTPPWVVVIVGALGGIAISAL